jgi:hypothetical protein
MLFPALLGGAALYEFTFSTATTEPPTGSQIRFNDTVYDAVTRVWVRVLAGDGRDVFYGLMAGAAGDALYVQDKNDHLRLVQFDVTGAPVDKVDYVEFPVVYRTSTSLLVNGQAALLAIASPEPASPEPVPPLPDPEPPRVPLLSLSDAKLHLRITTTTDDADITAKTLEASNILVKYLKGRADPTWDATTVPPRIAAGVKLLLTHLYEHRGDDPETDEQLWAALTRLLMRDRDPALA